MLQTAGANKLLLRSPATRRHRRSTPVTVTSSRCSLSIQVIDWILVVHALLPRITGTPRRKERDDVLGTVCVRPPASHARPQSVSRGSAALVYALVGVAAKSFHQIPAIVRHRLASPRLHRDTEGLTHWGSFGSVQPTPLDPLDCEGRTMVFRLISLHRKPNSTEFPSQVPWPPKLVIILTLLKVLVGPSILKRGFYFW